MTGRDIITLWVARMVIAGMYNLGDLPFEHCFVHANILDGKGEMMSKSAGNGIDPVDIIERYGADALRYVMCELQTGSQDIRLPVQAVSPFTGKTIELATAEHGQTIFTYLCPDTGKEFDVLGTMPDLPGATLISDRFDVGRSFCTKLWNAARFAFMSLRGYRHRERPLGELAAEDRWILSRLSGTCAAVQEQLQSYRPSAALAAVREFFWGDLCDWYLELIKPRVAAADPDETDADAARQTVAAVLDGTLRLLHPFVPFISETLWAHLRELAPRRGIAGWQPADAELLAVADWPRPDARLEDAALEADVDRLRGIARAVRDLRARHGVEARKPLDAVIRPTGDGGGRSRLDAYEGLIRRAAGLGSLRFAAGGAPPGRLRVRGRRRPRDPPAGRGRRRGGAAAPGEAARPPAEAGRRLGAEAGEPGLPEQRRRRGGRAGAAAPGRRAGRAAGRAAEPEPPHLSESRPGPGTPVSGWQLLAARPRFRRLVASSALWYATRAYELVVLSWLVLELTDSVAAVAGPGRCPRPAHAAAGVRGRDAGRPRLAPAPAAHHAEPHPGHRRRLRRLPGARLRPSPGALTS